MSQFFNFLSDYINIGLVCKKWYRIIVGLIDLNRSTFSSCFQTGEIEWRSVCIDENQQFNSNSLNKIQFQNQQATRQNSRIASISNPQPQKRHSHSCAILGYTLYVFGGLSATSTAYNDLWLLDLNTKRWTRPNTSGTYPSPKAAATLLSNDSKKELILYGGYSHPFSYPFNQQVNFFDEFHVYSARKNSWQAHVFTQEAPKLAGHSASFLRNFMILFGGCNSTLGNKSNSVYCLGEIKIIFIPGFHNTG